MIRLGRLTDYGIVLMAHLAGAGEGPHAARDLAAETQLPLPAVSKLLNSSELHDQLVVSMGKLDSVLDKVNNGDGTIGRLMNDPSLFESLDATTRDMQGFLKEFRANPKKFLTITVKFW